MKSSIKLSVLTLSLLFIFTITANAQDVPAGKATTTRSGIRLSVGPDVSLPIGSLGDHYDWSIGGSVQAEYPILKDQLYVTLNAGYNNFFAKDNTSAVETSDLQMIPVKAGLKYFPIHNFYIQGEAGASFLTNKSDIGATKSTTFVYAPQIGYMIPIGGNNAIDAGVRFEGNTKFIENGSSNNFLGLRVAYSFGL
jgi:hypothetical protein